MKIYRFLFGLMLGIFLLSCVSATSSAGAWADGSQSATISYGNSASFNYYFAGTTPPLSMTIKLYNSAGNFVYSFLDTSTPNNYYFNDAPIPVTASIYKNPGTYYLTFYSNDASNSPNTMSITLNVLSPPPDTIPPAIILNSPSNGFVTNSSGGFSTITFNGTVSDNVAVTNVTLYANFLGMWVPVQTNSSGLNNTNYPFILTISNGTYLWNYRACDTSGNCAFNPSNMTLTILPPQQSDTIPPAIVLNSPQNNFVTNSSLITLSGTVSDNVAVANVTLYGNFSGVWAANQINSSGLNNSNYLFVLNLPNGTYLWNYRACDTSGNCAFNSANMTFAIIPSQNQTNPILQIQFIPPTPSTNSQLSQSIIPVAVSIINSSTINATYVFLYNSTFSLIRNVTVTPSAVNFTNLSPDTYYLNATVFDNSGNANSTNTVAITLLSSATPSNPSNLNVFSGNSGYSYVDVYQNQNPQQLSQTSPGISIGEQQQAATAPSSGFIILLAEILFVLILAGVIIFIFTKRRFG